MYFEAMCEVLKLHLESRSYRSETSFRRSESESPKEYVCTKPGNWSVLINGEDGRAIELIPFTGESEEFSVKISDEGVTGLKDDNGDI